MTKVAIYARYSSDLQTDASIEDQIRLCEDRAEREGWNVYNHYTDHGISGASMMRPGIQMLMQDAAAGRFDTIISEALDRLSRDQEDIAGIYKRIQFADVKIITLSEGEVSNLHIGLKGTMNALFLKDLADKTRRGLSGRVLKGKSGGGITYGYDIVRKLDGNGELIKGERKINQEQALIVRRIFEEYVTGKSPKAIAVQLNKEGIKGPSGKDWGPSTIYGNRRRGTGIINNELYVGRLVWNRLRYIKAPDTGKRISRINPEDEWIITDVPEMRIIDQDLWDSVRTKQKDLNDRNPEFWNTARPKYLFSNLLKCGCCGGGFSKVSQKHYGCSTARNKGTCDNRKTIMQERLEEAVLNSLQNHLMDPKHVEIFCKEYTNHMNRLRMEHNASRTGYQAEYDKLQRAQDKHIIAIEEGFANEDLKIKMNANYARRQELKDLLENADEAPPLLHPSMAKRYRDEVTSLVTSLNDENHRAEASELIRSLIEKIVLTPDPESGELVLDLHGDLAGILDMAASKGKPATKAGYDLGQAKLVAGIRNTFDLISERKMLGQGNSQGPAKLVAGVGFEPTTFRL